MQSIDLSFEPLNFTGGLQLLPENPRDDQLISYIPADNLESRREADEHDVYVYQEEGKIWYAVKTSTGIVREKIEEREYKYFDYLLEILKKKHPGAENVDDRAKAALLKITSKRGHTITNVGGLFGRENTPKYKQDQDAVMPFLSPVGLDKQGGINLVKVNDKPCKTCRYFENHTSLESYLENIMNDLRTKEVKQPVAFLLSSMNHSMSIGFYPDTQEYIFLAPNQLPAISIKDPRLFAELIAEEFNPHHINPQEASPIILAITAYASTNDEMIKQNIKEAFDQPSEIPAAVLDPNNDFVELSVEFGVTDIIEQLLIRDNITQELRDEMFKKAYTYQNETVIELMLSLLAKADPNQTLLGKTLLSHALKAGLTDLVTKLLEASSDQINDINRAMYSAVKYGQTEIVNLLIQQGADRNLMDNSDPKMSLLMIAASHGYSQIVRQLLTAENINQQDGNGNTPLMHATKYGHIEIMKLLIENGAEISKCNKYDDNLLHLAAYGGVHDEIVKFLIQSGVNVNQVNSDGQTPLMVAVHGGEIEIVKSLLLEGGADPNMRDIRENKTRLTALHDCAYLYISADSDDVNGQNYPYILKLLLEYKADQNIKDINGKKPVDYAIDTFKEDLLEDNDINDIDLSDIENKIVAALQELGLQPPEAYQAIHAHPNHDSHSINEVQGISTTAEIDQKLHITHTQYANVTDQQNLESKNNNVDQPDVPKETLSKMIKVAFSDLEQIDDSIKKGLYHLSDTEGGYKLGAFLTLIETESWIKKSGMIDDKEARKNIYYNELEPALRKIVELKKAIAAAQENKDKKVQEQPQASGPKI